jgi:flagellar biosynthesis GTPase FlhF
VEPVPVAPIEPANPNEPANPVEPVLSRWAQRRSARGRLAPERLALEAPRAAPAPAAPGRELDSAAAAAVVSELIERDLSEGWACQLVVAAAAHRGPFTSGDLRDCVRATLAASIPTPAPLPSLGAAVAIVGAGGAGKTRCAAALASAYGRGSTLPVSVVSLGGNDLGAGMAMLLQDEGIPLHAGTTWDAVAEEVAKAREEGLVVIDTVAVGPGEAAVTEALGGDLEALAPDAIFLAIPGTVSAHAGMKLISAFKPLGLAGIAITHADETDHLGIVVELAGTSGLPLAYLNGGLDLHSALSVADASLLARTLLP